MIRRNRTLSRRAVLRGAGGVAIGLPFLEAMQPRQAVAASDTRRLVLFFTPNGTNDFDAFLPKETGSGFTLKGAETSPLAPLRDDLTVMSGVDMTSATMNEVGDLHSIGMSHMLTATDAVKADGYAQPGGGDYFVSFAGGPSIDQVVAKKLQAPTKFASIELGVQSTVGIGVHPFSRMIYKDRLQFVPPEDDPRAVFSRLFTGSSTSSASRIALEQRASVLDFVRDHYTKIKPRLSMVDQQKVAAHLDSIRQLEKRIGSQPTATPSACTAPADPAMKASGAMWHLEPKNFPDVGKLQMDLLAVALACDLTRVASLQWSWARSTAAFPWVGVPDAHHDLSHGPASEALSKINNWYATQLADFVTALKTSGELDNTVVWWCSDVATGAHDFWNARAFLFGKCGGYFKPGQHIAFDHASHNQLHITLMHAMGLPDSKFGKESLPQGPLPGFS